VPRGPRKSQGREHKRPLRSSPGGMKLSDEFDANLFAIGILTSHTAITPAQVKLLYKDHERSCKDFLAEVRKMFKSTGVIDLVQTSQENWISHNRSAKEKKSGLLDDIKRRINRYMNGGREDEDLWAPSKHRGRGRPRKERHGPVPEQSAGSDVSEPKHEGGDVSTALYTGPLPTPANG